MAVTVVMRVGMRILAKSIPAQRFVVRTMTPLSVPVVDPILADTPPKNPRTWTPEEARAHHGMVSPAEQYAAIQAARAGKPLPAHASRDGAEPLLAFS